MVEVTPSTPSGGGSRQIPIVCPGHTRPLAELQFLAVKDEDESRTFLVSACHDKMPMLRDGVSGDWIGTFAGHKGAVWCCRLDPSGYLAATASGDFSVKVWDGITGKELHTYQHKHIVKTLDFSPDSRRLATGGHEGLLRIYELSQPKAEPVAVPQLKEKKINITKCNWLDDNVLLAACSDGGVRFWDVSTSGEPKLLRTLKVDAEVRDMEISPGKKLLTVAAGTKVNFFDLSSYELVRSHKMPIHFRDEGGASLHPDGTKFVAGGSDLWVRLFDFDSGEQLECHKGHHGPLRCLRFSPDGKTFATGSEDGTIRLWNTESS